MTLFGKKKEENKTPSCACNCDCQADEVNGIVNDCCEAAKEGICCIKVLGSGCKSCHALLENTKEAVNDYGKNAEMRRDLREYITVVH